MGTSRVLPGICAGASFLMVEAVRGFLNISRQTLGGAVVYGALFSVGYVVLLRLTSRQQCREVVSFLPGRSHLERWLVLGT
jgi:hypothetical protein